MLICVAVTYDSPVVVRSKTVIEYPVDFMYPQPDELVTLSHVSIWHEEYAIDNPREISQVEHVVRLGGGGQKSLNGLLVYFHCSLHQDLKQYA